MKAFITELYGIKGVVFSEKSGSARYRAYLSAKDAGYNPSLIEIKVKRAVEFDYLEDILNEGKCYALSYAQGVCI
jgi:hypothetical protein